VNQPNIITVAADTKGRISGMGNGRSFLILPSGLYPGSPVGLSALVGRSQRPQDHFAGGGQLEMPEDFDELAFTGCTPGGTYLVGVFPAGVKYRSTGAKSVQTAFQVWQNSNLPTNGPNGTMASGNVFNIYGSWTGFNLAFTNASGPTTVNMWASPLPFGGGGTYRFAGQIISAADWQLDGSSSPDYQAVVWCATPFKGGSVYLQAGAANTVAELDVAYEVQG
jgi:hypothetical protein